MSKDLARSTSSSRGLARGGAAAQPDPGQGQSISGASFDEKGYTYDNDIPTKFRQGAAESTAVAVRGKESKRSSELVPADQAVPLRSDAEMAKIAKQAIASGARQLDKPRKVAGRVVQRRVGWRATPALIVIATAERELTRSEDGKFRPSGEWLLEHRKTYQNADGAAKKRTGNVAVDEQPSSASSNEAGGVAPSAVRAKERFPEGDFTLSFLPPSVRSSVLARVPVPVVFDGTVLQFTQPDGSVDHQEINLIRMDEKTAVVVQASRKPEDKNWSVSQALYALTDPEVEQA